MIKKGIFLSIVVFFGYFSGVSASVFDDFQKVPRENQLFKWWGCFNSSGSICYDTDQRGYLLDVASTTDQDSNGLYSWYYNHGPAGLAQSFKLADSSENVFSVPTYADGYSFYMFATGANVPSINYYNGGSVHYSYGYTVATTTPLFTTSLTSSSVYLLKFNGFAHDEVSDVSYYNNGSRQVFGIFYTDQDLSYIDTEAEMITFIAEYQNYGYPTLAVMNPAPNTTYGNPVKIDGAIVNATEFDIYSGNERDTTDVLELSGFSPSGSSQDFWLDHAFYSTTGSRWINIVASNSFGTATSSYMFYVGNYVSAWGTSTIPSWPYPSSENQDLASSTASSFFDGFFESVEDNCDMNFWEVFSLTAWKACGMGTFDYISEWVADRSLNLATGALRKWPWGYGYRVYEILTTESSTSTLPSLAFTFPAGYGLPVGAVGKSFDFDAFDSMSSAVATIRSASPTTAQGDIMDSFLYWWNFIWYIGFAFYLIYKIKSFVH